MTGKAPAASAEIAKWTVMVYLAGDNNLTDECIYAMTEMKKVGSGDGLNIITQFDPRDEYLPTHRYRIGQNGNSASLSEDILSTAEDGKFVSTDKFAKLPGESARAKSHDDVRSGAHRVGKKAILAEARRLAQEKAKARAAARAKAKAKVKGKQNVARAVATQETVPAKEPVILGVEEEVGPGQNDTDTGSPITLYNFMSLCVEQFPAEHYMVVLAGHASGTARDFLLKDDSPVGSLTINELKRAFEELQSELDEGQVIDILGMDVCLMSMAEVACELEGLVKIMVGSESYSPASGWPYAPILGRLKTRIAGLNPEAEKLLPPDKKIEYEFAKDIVAEYVKFYSDYALSGLSVDQSALDVTVVATLKKYIDEFASAMKGALLRGTDVDKERFKDALLLAHWEAQSYNGEQFVDIFDFCDCLLRRHAEGTVAETGKTLMNFISEKFVLKSCYSGPVYQYSYGVSIYFPWSKVDAEYRNLDFNKNETATGWLSFLDNYVSLTRRKARNIDEKSKLGRFNSRGEPQRFRMSQGKGPDNPIRSMRNPPIVFGLTQCIEEDARKKEIIEGQEKLCHRILSAQ